jgi:predicted aspartyl protease
LEVRDCFDAEDWGYAIEASLLNPLQDLRFPESGKILMKVDTGFTGPVLVTTDVFEFLRLSDIEVPDEIRPTYRTLAGAFTMRSAPAMLEVNGKRLETDILAPLLGPSKLLIGCRIIRELNLALLGKKTCFVSLQL